MLRTIRPLVVALAALLVAGSAVSAYAAPTAWQSVDVTLQTEEQQSMLLVSGLLPPTATLPSEAELAVPTGTQLQWIGEVLGGAVSADPEVKYVKSSAGGMDIYRFTLTRARTAQVEGIVPAPGGFQGANYVSAWKWTAWQPLPEVRISQRIPKSSQIVSAAPGATLQPGGTGSSFYTKSVKDVKAGQVLDLAFSYTPVAAGGASAAGATDSSSGNIALVAIVAAFIGGFGFLFYNVRRKLGSQTVDEETPAVTPRKTTASAKKSASSARRIEHVQPEEAAPAPSKRVKPAVFIVGVVGILIGVVVMAGAKGTSANVVNGKITKSFGAANPCTSASIPVTANPGVNLASQGEKLIDSFVGQTGVGDVTLDLATSTLDITFCESSQSEDSVRKTLTGTGLVSVGAAPASAASVPVTATIDPSGKKQTASVDTASGRFSPKAIVLKAGVPIELAFGAAASCVTEVIFAELNVKQDLTAGPATVKLPALDAGTYTFNCPMGHEEGTLTVQ